MELGLDLSSSISRVSDFPIHACFPSHVHSNINSPGRDVHKIHWTHFCKVGWCSLTYFIMTGSWLLSSCIAVHAQQQFTGIQVQSGELETHVSYLWMTYIVCVQMCHTFPANYTSHIQALLIPRRTSWSREKYEKKGIQSWLGCLSTNLLYPRSQEMWSTESNQPCLLPAVARKKKLGS